MNISNPLVHMLSYSPTMDMYEPDGITFTAHDPYSSISSDNPYALLTAVKSEHMMHTVNGRFDLKFNIGHGFTFTTTNGLDYRDAKNYGFRPKRMGLNWQKQHEQRRCHLMLQTTNSLTY